MMDGCPSVRTHAPLNMSRLGPLSAAPNTGLHGAAPAQEAVTGRTWPFRHMLVQPEVTHTQPRMLLAQRRQNAHQSCSYPSPNQVSCMHSCRALTAVVQRPPMLSTALGPRKLNPAWAADLSQTPALMLTQEPFKHTAHCPTASMDPPWQSSNVPLTDLDCIKGNAARSDSCRHSRDPNSCPHPRRP